jgi:integrase
MVKAWAKEVGVTTQNISSHSLRKTFCRAMVDQYDEPLHVLMWALNHSSERQTAQYLGLLHDDVARLYEHVV